jgi:hypothetical protein
MFSKKRVKKMELPGTNTLHSKYLKTMNQGYCWTVWDLNGVLVGVKLKKGLGAGSFSGVNGAGGLKF